MEGRISLRQVHCALVRIEHWRDQRDCCICQHPFWTCLVAKSESIILGLFFLCPSNGFVHSSPAISSLTSALQKTNAEDSRRKFYQPAHRLQYETSLVGERVLPSAIIVSDPKTIKQSRP